MTVAFLFACVGLGALGLSFWGWVSCFSNPEDSRKALASFALRRLGLRREGALPLHPAKGHRPSRHPFGSACLFIG